MKMKNKVFIPILFLIFFGGKLYSQPMQVWDYATYPIIANPTHLVEDVLITGCLQAFNVTYTGDNLSIGYFHRNPAALPPNWPFAGGIVMTSGLAQNAKGPNNSGGTSYNSTGPSDPTLNAIIPQTTNDACVLDFDFIPADNVVAFRYIFGSEEYLEYVGSSFNDVFAFFLSGPNCNTALNNYNNLNIALVPGAGATPVSINNVNSVANSAFYYNNGNGSTPAGQACQYDGYTVPLWAHKCVIPCQTYHIKLAIADAGDSVLDSGVFLEEGSFSSGEVVSMNNVNPVGDDTQIIEGCENFYIFTRTDTTDTSDSIQILMSISGTATVGGDISGFPPSFWIPIGQVSDTIFYSALLDNIVEGTEYLIFTLLNGCPCTVGGTNDTIWIIDNVTLEGGILQNDTLICSSTTPSVTLNAVATTDPAITHYLWSTGATSTQIVVQPLAGTITTYSVDIWDDCGQAISDSVRITVSNMSTLSIATFPLTCNNVCTGHVLVTPMDGFAPYTFSWNPGGLGSTTVGEAFNVCAGNYTVSVSDTYGCVKSETFTITEPPAVTLTFSSVPASCPGASDGTLTVNVANGFPPYQFSGTGLTMASGISTSSYTFINITAGNYTVNVMDGKGCLASNIYPVNELVLTYTSNITDVSCSGYQDGKAQLNISGGTPPYLYEWTNGQSSSLLNNVIAGNYTCTVTDSHDCQITVPVTIEEPDILTMANSLDTIMCLGETATILVEANGGTTPYSYNWSSGLVGNPVQVSPPESTPYTVTVVDANGCEASSPGVLVAIYPEVDPKAYANIDSICKGESTVLYIDVVGGNGGPYVYSNDLGEIIKMPLTVQPEVTTTYSIFADDNCGSPQGSSTVTIFVMNPEPGSFTVDDTIGCAPLTVKFNETSPNVGQSYFWKFDDLIQDGYSVTKSPLYTFHYAGKYDVALTVTSAFGCPTTIEMSDMITVFPQPEANFLPDPESAKITLPVIFFENRTLGGVIDRITYNFGDGTSTTLEIDVFTDISHRYGDTGTYMVQMVAENTQGCIDTTTRTIHIMGDHAFYAPNAFNPQSLHAENRIFRPLSYGIDIDSYQLIIYDRWGHKVFETFEFYHGWDGRINGGEIGPIGSYPWVVIYKDDLGQTVRQSGVVNLIE